MAQDKLRPELAAQVRKARNKTFHDGLDSELARSIRQSIREHGTDAVDAWETILQEDEFNAQDELLRQIGLLDDPGTRTARRRLLANCLDHPDCRLRDAAGLGISFLDDPEALPELREALVHEETAWVRSNLQLVILQLEETEREQT